MQNKELLDDIWLQHALIKSFKMSLTRKRDLYTTVYWCILVRAFGYMYMHKRFQSSLTHLAFSSLSLILIINKLTVIKYSSMSYQLKTIIYIWTGWEIQMLNNLPGSVILI